MTTSISQTIGFGGPQIPAYDGIRDLDGDTAMAGTDVIQIHGNGDQKHNASAADDSDDLYDTWLKRINTALKQPGDESSQNIDDDRILSFDEDNNLYGDDDSDGSYEPEENLFDDWHTEAKRTEIEHLIALEKGCQPFRHMVDSMITFPSFLGESFNDDKDENGNGEEGNDEDESDAEDKTDDELTQVLNQIATELRDCISETSDEEVFADDEITSGEEWTDDEEVSSPENMKLDGGNLCETDNAPNTETVYNEQVKSPQMTLTLPMKRRRSPSPFDQREPGRPAAKLLCAPSEYISLSDHLWTLSVATVGLTMMEMHNRLRRTLKRPTMLLRPAQLQFPGSYTVVEDGPQDSTSRMVLFRFTDISDGSIQPAKDARTTYGRRVPSVENTRRHGKGFGASSAVKDRLIELILLDQRLRV